MEDQASRLRALLEELHGELSRLPEGGGSDDVRRTQLLDLKADIERLLAHQEDADSTVAPHEREHLQGRLQALAAGFEGAHPQLASALEQTMNALSNMGL